MAKPLPSIETLRKLLSYDPVTWQLYWRPRTPDMFEASASRSAEHICSLWNSLYAGKECFNYADRNGRTKGTILSEEFVKSRIVWKLHTGKDPVGVIDHINGETSDNRVENLRDVDSSGNSKNAKLRTDSTSGVPGVSFYKRSKKWWAYINSNGKRVSLGHYINKKDAIEARKAAEKMHGFHPNHGRTQ